MTGREIFWNHDPNDVAKFEALLGDEQRRAVFIEICVAMADGDKELFVRTVPKLDNLEFTFVLKGNISCVHALEFENPQSFNNVWLDTARDGYCVCLTHMPEMAEEPDHLGYAGLSLIHVTCFLGDEFYLDHLIKLGCDVNNTSCVKKFAPIHYIVTNSQCIKSLEVLLRTLKNGEVTENMQGQNEPMDTSPSKHVVDLKAFDYRRRSPFLLAMMDAFLWPDAVDMLLNEDIDVNTPDIWDNYPLMVALNVKYDNQDFQVPNLIERIMQKGCNPNIIGSPLTTATCNRGSDDIEVLLRYGADINMAGDGYTPLMTAAGCGYQGIVKQLIKHNADVNFSIPPSWYSALHFAAWEGNAMTVLLLLDAGAKPDEQTRDKNTPLSLAAHGDHYQVVSSLLKRGDCNVNNTDKDLDTPMHYAAYNGCERTVKALIEHGANPDIPNALNTTPLWNACFKDAIDVVKLLLDLNVRMEVSTKGIHQHSNTDDLDLIYEDVPRSPLYAALDQYGYATVQYLIFAGYDLSKEKWLIDDDFECTVQDQIEIFEWLKNKARNVDTLKHLCKRKIRSCLGRGAVLDKKVETFELPTRLKDYLLLKVD